MKWEQPPESHLLKHTRGTNLTPHKHTMVTDTLNVSLTVTGEEHHLPKQPSFMCAGFLFVCVGVGLSPFSTSSSLSLQLPPLISMAIFHITKQFPP